MPRALTPRASYAMSALTVVLSLLATVVIVVFQPGPAPTAADAAPLPVVQVARGH